MRVEVDEHRAVLGRDRRGSPRSGAQARARRALASGLIGTGSGSVNSEHVGAGVAQRADHEVELADHRADVDSCAAACR